MKPEMKFELISVSDIFPSGNNPRPVNKESQSFKDLVESVKANGVKVPVMVRIHPTKKDKYELLAGNRRMAAAEIAKLETIGCLINLNITDEQAFDITFIENFAREDLTVLQEGKAATILLEKYKGDAKAAAAKIGKPIQWIMQRAAIETKLCDEVKKRILKAKPGQGTLAFWTASHLQLISALPENLQIGILKEFEYGDMPSTKQLESHIRQLLRPLSKAPWQFEEVTEIEISGVKKKVRCDKCLKRTASQPGLFDDTTEPDKLLKNDRCMDSKCWTLRMAKHLLQKADELRKEQPKLVFLAAGVSRYDSEADVCNKLFGQVVFEHQYNEAKKTDKTAIPALIVNGTSAGQIKYIKPINTGNSSRQSPKDENGKKVAKPMKERMLELEKKRWFAITRLMMDAIKKTTIENIKPQKGKDKTFEAVKLAVFLGTDSNKVCDINKRKYFSNNDASIMSKYRTDSKAKDTSGLATLLFEAVKPKLIAELHYNGPLTQTPESYFKTAKAIAELMQFDMDDFYKKACEEYPVPKSWAAEKATDKKPEKKAEKKERKCSVCGCTEGKACDTPDGPCHWVTKDLCSGCTG